MMQICEGKSVTQGIAIGKIVSVTKGKSLPEKISKDDILLLENSDPVNAILIMDAGGVVIKEGGVLAHTCLLALEMGIPCITQVGEDTEIQDGGMVLLNAGEGKVYKYDSKS